MNDRISIVSVFPDHEHRKAEIEAAREARSLELEDMRYGEDCVYNVASAPDKYTMGCGCVWSRGRGWTKECDDHE